MTIDIDYWLYDKNGKILKLQHIIISEDDIIDMLKSRYDNDELSIPINYIKDNIVPKFGIDKIHIWLDILS